MLLIKPGIKPNRFVFLWAVGIIIGWALITYPGLTLRDEVRVIHSWAMLLPISLNLFFFTFLMGAVIGLVQYLFCRQDLAISWRWVFVSALSYGFGTSAGFLLSSLVLGNPEIFSNNGTSFLSVPLDFIMLIGGGLTALSQALAIRNIFLGNIKELLLWALATALSWEVGFFIASYAGAANLPIFMQSGLAGLAIGLGSALLLNFEMKNKPNGSTHPLKS